MILNLINLVSYIIYNKNLISFPNTFNTDHIFYKLNTKYIQYY